MRNSGQPGGLYASLQRLFGTALDLAQVRLQILGNEVEEEKLRLMDGVFWGALALVAFDVGLVLLCGFITLLFWDGYRLVAIGVMALLFLAFGVLLLREARQRLRNPAGMFSVSLDEFKRDRAGVAEPGHE